MDELRAYPNGNTSRIFRLEELAYTIQDVAVPHVA